MAIISLEGMRFYAFHGFYEEERKAGGEYEIDLWVDADTSVASATDDLFQTVNYETLYVFCQSEMKQPSALIEHVAQRLIARITKHFGQVSGVRVVLRKLQPPLGGPVAHAAVDIRSGTMEDMLPQFMKMMGPDNDLLFDE